METNGSMSIGDVARETGLRQSAIRYYEEQGLLPSPPRRGGWRRFDPPVLARLQVIRAARDLGFTLNDIRALLADVAPDATPPERWRALARDKLPEVDAALRRLTALRRLLIAGMGCRCATIEECFLDDCSADERLAGRGVALPIAPPPTR
jgi:MerR family transcriptional regulator, redox-sensitive transcriptional activator SoxR